MNDDGIHALSVQEFTPLVRLDTTASVSSVLAIVWSMQKRRLIRSEKNAKRFLALRRVNELLIGSCSMKTLGQTGSEPSSCKCRSTMYDFKNVVTWLTSLPSPSR
jgi:hypothetical protein